jgi:tripartite-type tricarboxylate transporter receptor subunit TctC
MRSFVKTLVARLPGLAAALLLAAHAAHAADNTPIRLLVGFPPGGGTDVMARHLAKGLEGELKRSVLVDNHPGAGGQIAAQMLKAAKPDGTTLFLSNSHTISMIPLTLKNPGYKPLEDFAPVGLAAIAPDVLVTGPAVAGNVNSLKEFGEWARAHPAQANVGVPAPASPPDFAVGLIGKGLGVELKSVPYRGDAPVAQDVIAGQVAAGIGGVGVMLEYAKAGKLKILAVDGVQRLPILPDVPTYAELGIKGYEEVIYTGVYAPAGTPAAVIERYSAAIAKVVNSAEFRQKLAAIGFVAQSSTPAELLKRQAETSADWAGMVKNAGYLPQ